MKCHACMAGEKWAPTFRTSNSSFGGYDNMSGSVLNNKHIGLYVIIMRESYFGDVGLCGVVH